MRSVIDIHFQQASRKHLPWDILADLSFAHVHLFPSCQVAGEAAGYGLGLLFVGTASEKTFEMLAYAHDTQHEKIIRGVSMGLALIMYGRRVPRIKATKGKPICWGAHSPSTIGSAS